MKKIKKILIIGKKSFLGSNLFNYLKNKVNSDIFDYKDLNLKKISNYDYIINCAVTNSYINKKYNVKNDIDTNLLNFLSSSKTKIIFLSTRKVYKQGDDLKETSFLKPFHNYEKNKLKTEYNIKKFYGKNHLILRISNVVGLRIGKKVHDTYTDVFFNYVKKNIILNNKGLYKDFISIDDFCKVIYLLIKKEISGTYNLSIGRKIFLKNLNKNLLHFYKNKEKLRILENIYNNQSFYLNNNKLFKKIKYKPSYKNLVKSCLKLSKLKFSQ